MQRFLPEGIWGEEPALQSGGEEKTLMNRRKKFWALKDKDSEWTPTEQQIFGRLFFQGEMSYIKGSLYVRR